MLKHLALLLSLSTIVLFQNCSPVSFNESALESIEAASSSLRKIEIDPTYDSQQSTNDIKVLLIVDNSGTMVNSQKNLARNLSGLVSQIQNYNVEILVSTTTFSQDKKICNPQNTLCTAYPAYSAESIHTGTTAYYGLNPNTQLKTFNLKTSMTNQQRADTLAALSNHVMSLGIQGSDQEAPLAVLASQLEGTSAFLKQGDRALIYIVSDEDDTYSIPFLKNPKVSSVTTSGNSSSVEPGVYYTWNSGYSIDARCPVRRENGDIVRYEYGGVIVASCDPQVISSYQNSGCLNVSCNPKVFSGEAFLNGSSVADRCQSIQNTIGTELNSCVALSLNKINPAEILSASYTYFFGMTKEQAGNADVSYILTNIKKRMDSLLGQSYLVAMSANFSNEKCILSTGQTQDTLLSRFASLFSSQQVFMNSICGQSFAGGQALASIVNQFEKVLSGIYVVDLQNNEKISSVSVRSRGQIIPLQEGTDYTIQKDSFQLIKKLDYSPEKFVLYISN